MLPQRQFLEIRCSEIASEAILWQKQSGSSYMARGVLHPIFDCAYICKASWLGILTREGTTVGRTAGGVTSGVNSQSSAWNSDLFTHVFTHVLWSQRRKQLTRVRSALVLHEQTCIAATRLIWTAMILNSSQTSGSLSNGRALEMYS